MKNAWTSAGLELRIYRSIENSCLVKMRKKLRKETDKAVLAAVVSQIIFESAQAKIESWRQGGSLLVDHLSLITESKCLVYWTLLFKKLKGV